MGRDRWINRNTGNPKPAPEAMDLEVSIRVCYIVDAHPSVDTESNVFENHDRTTGR
jgi:hypothetical protein